jgi:hypothetical protein
MSQFIGGISHFPNFDISLFGPAVTSITVDLETAPFNFIFNGNFPADAQVNQAGITVSIRKNVVTFSSATPFAAVTGTLVFESE